MKDFDPGLRGIGADVPLKVKFAADLEEIEKEKGGPSLEKRSSEAPVAAVLRSLTSQPQPHVEIM